MTELEFEIKKPGNIRDTEVLEQLPTDVIQQLGENLGTGYDLRHSRREIFFEGGYLEYNPYRNKCIVKLGTHEELGIQSVDMTEAFAEYEARQKS